MSHIRNASEYLMRLRTIRSQYEEQARSHIARWRATLTTQTGTQVDDTIEESLLEAHLRVYFTDGVLDALNWRVFPSSTNGGSVVTEAAVTSKERGTTRYMDYLGTERETDLPLLVVETKRPRSPLPERRNATPGLPEALTAVVAAGLGGASLRGDWDEWLGTHRDYIRSVQAKTGQTPRRSVMTDGHWFVIFLNPSDAFLPGGTIDPTGIIGYATRDEFEQNYDEVFKALEYYLVLGETPSLAVASLPFHLTGADLERVMHGVRLCYIQEPNIYSGHSPVIKVAPVLFLRTHNAAWLRAEDPALEFTLPHESTELKSHLSEVADAAATLLARVSQALDVNVSPTSLTDHYQADEVFDSLPGVIEQKYRRHERTTDFMLVTGTYTHFLLAEPTVFGCPHHDWLQSNRLNVSWPSVPILKPMTTPRSFFKSGQAHHCSHRDVYDAKATQITNANRMRCGVRSGPDGAPFCEIAPFEQHLCCRTCAFQDVCTKAQVFRLPCGVAVANT